MKRLLVILLFIAACSVEDQNPVGGNMAFTPSVSWGDKELLTDTKLNTMATNDDELKILVDGCVLAGPTNTGDARLTSGTKSGSLSSINTTDVVVVFSTDSDQGDPGFDGLYSIALTLEVTSGEQKLLAIITSKSDSGFTATVLSADGSNVTSSFVVHFLVYGPTD